MSVSCLSAVLGAGALLHSYGEAHAQEPAAVEIFSPSKDFPFEIWFRGAREKMPSTLTAWAQDLQRLIRYPLFQGPDRLPSPTAILVDPNWTLTSGYWSTDLRSPLQTPAILISAQSISGDPQRDRAILIHELTHLMQYRLRPHEESWVREGVALLAEYQVTGHFSPSMLLALLEPETSLVADLNLTAQDHFSKRASLPQYGHLTQYFYYLYRLCGKDRLLDTLLSSPDPASGITFLDHVLAASGSQEPACQSFEASFTRFEQARFLDSPYSLDAYVMHTRQKAKLQPGPGFTLPPYSAGAYELLIGSHCLPGEFEWGARRCIRVRKN